MKGPQGTRYGRNAVGGLINIITKAPEQTFGMDASVCYADYGTLTANGYVTGGLTEGLSVSLSGVFRNQDKRYSRNLITDKTAGREKYEAGRAKLLWEFGSSNSLLIGGGFAHSNNNIANDNSSYPGSVPLTAQIPGTVYGTKRGQFAASLEPRFEVRQYMT